MIKMNINEETGNEYFFEPIKDQHTTMTQFQTFIHITASLFPPPHTMTFSPL